MSKGKHLFVTGVNGTAGRTLVEHALAEGKSIKAIARRDIYKNRPGISVQCGDLGDLPRSGGLGKLLGFDGFMSGVGDIIHLAASRKNDKDRDIYKDISIIGRLLDYWKGGGFSFASSQIVYRVGEAPCVLSEDSPIEPVNWYAASKIMSEQMIIAQHMMNSSKGQAGHYAIFRIPLVMHTEMPGKPHILDVLIRRVVRSKDIYFPCNESSSLDYGSSWVGTQDLAKAMLQSLQFPESGIFNIASGYVSYVEFIEKIIRKTNSRSRMRFNTRGPIWGLRIPPYDYCLDTRKLSAAGYTPCDNLDNIMDTYLMSMAK